MAAFVTADQYATALRVDVPDGSPLEAAVNMALDAACSEIRGYLGQTLDAVVGDVVALDGTGRRGLILPEMPVTAVNAVTIDKDLATELVVTDFYLGFGGVLYRTGVQAVPDWWDWWDWSAFPRRGWPLGVGNITVDNDHGYATIPADLVNVAIQVARATINSGLPGMTSETIGGYSYTRDGKVDILGAFTRVLDNYKLPRVMVA